MSAHSLPYDFLLAPWVVPDPGASGTIDTAAKGFAICSISTAAAEARTVLAPKAVGQILMLSMKADTGDCTVTVKNSAGSTTSTLTLDDPGDFNMLVGTDVGGTLTWKSLAV